ncbi:hypothetical protein Tco_0454745 [Tanacetum coccineum]
MSKDTTPDVIMAGTNVALPLVVSSVLNNITKEGCRAHIGEEVNKPNDRINFSYASTDNMGYVSVEKPCAASSPNSRSIENGSEQVDNTPVNVVPLSYATKLMPTSSTMANLRKLEANVPNDADYKVWLPLDSIHEINDKMKNLQYYDNLVMAMPNLEGYEYTKETIRVEYEWKAPCKGESSRTDDEGFVEVKKKKSCGNGTFSFSNLFEALNVENSVGEEGKTGNKASMSGVKEVGQSSTSLVERLISLKHIYWRECVLVDDDVKPLKNVDKLGDQDSEDETEYVDNEMTSYLASKPSGVGYDTKSLLEQWRKKYE